MENKKKIKDKRKYHREALCVKFRLDTGEDVISAKSFNLSHNGIYCQVNKLIALMTKVRLTFHLPADGGKKKVVNCSGVVVRAEEDIDEKTLNNVFNIAIFFDEMEEKEKVKVLLDNM